MTEPVPEAGEQGPGTQESQARPAGPRLFLAIELSAEVKAAVADLASRIRTGAAFTGANPKWVDPEGYHITLWFLGSVANDTAGRLRGRLREAAAGVAPFDIDVRHVRCFPNTSAPRVLWIGLVRVPDGLKLLHAQCATLMRRVGIEPDKEHDFTPHITLARLKGARNLPAFSRMAANYKHAQCGRCTVSRLVLMESRPQPGGSVYSHYATAELAAEA